MLERGELRLGMDVQFRTSFRGMVYTVAILLALALLSVGLFLGSCILCTTAMEPRILGVPLLGVLGYLGAAALGVYVVVVAVRMRHRMRNGEDL
jgi:ubiquinone biosynthesis protein